jgi:hypothetical protein
MIITMPHLAGGADSLYRGINFKMVSEITFDRGGRAYDRMLC